MERVGNSFSLVYAAAKAVTTIPHEAFRDVDVPHQFGQITKLPVVFDFDQAKKLQVAKQNIDTLLQLKQTVTHSDILRALLPVMPLQDNLSLTLHHLQVALFPWLSIEPNARIHGAKMIIQCSASDCLQGKMVFDGKKRKISVVGIECTGGNCEASLLLLENSQTRSSFSWHRTVASKHKVNVLVYRRWLRAARKSERVASLLSRLLENNAKKSAMRKLYCLWENIQQQVGAFEDGVDELVGEEGVEEEVNKEAKENVANEPSEDEEEKNTHKRANPQLAEAEGGFQDADDGNRQLKKHKAPKKPKRPAQAAGMKLRKRRQPAAPRVRDEQEEDDGAEEEVTVEMLRKRCVQNYQRRSEQDMEVDDEEAVTVEALVQKMQAVADTSLESHLELGKLLTRFKEQEQATTTVELVHLLKAAKSTSKSAAKLMKKSSLDNHLRVFKLVTAFPLLRYCGESFSWLRRWLDETHKDELQQQEEEWALPKINEQSE